MRALKSFCVLMVVCIAGCEEAPRDATALIIDGTESAAKERRVFLDDLTNRLITGGYLQGDVCVVHVCAEPHVLFMGKAHQVKELKAAMALAAKPCRCNPDAESEPQVCGSDVAGGLDIVKSWLARPEFRSTKHRPVKHRVLIWSDFRNCPCKSGDKPRAFDDPFTLTWGDDLHPIIHIYGLPQERHKTIEEAWKKWNPCPHLPGETKLEPEHLGLRAQAL